MSEKIPVTGIPAGKYTPVDVPQRKEITALADADDRIGKIQWSLFVRALADITSKSITTPLGFFQLAGIHSEPRVPWNGVDPKNKEFCSHESNTFPTWHRPYMALFEQALWKSMKETVIPALKPRKLADWQAAADSWRLPYWDWARSQEYLETAGLPWCYTEEQLSIMTGTEGWENFPNPMWTFINPQKDSKGQPVAFNDASMGSNKWNLVDPDAPYDQSQAISRYGLVMDDSGKWSGFGGVNNWLMVNENLAHPAFYGITVTTMSESVNRMLTPGASNEPTTWRDFACSRRTRSDHQNFMSLEYVHNNVHNLTGGSDGNVGAGHMSEVAVAAFDPIFWLHHCNVDRLAAMWQALYPDRWFNGPSEPDQPTSTADLAPFYDKNGKFHNSEGVKDWTTLGYQYDDLVPRSDAWDGSKIVPDAYATQIRQLVKELYPSTSSIVSRDDEMPGVKTDDGEAYNDYILNVLYDRYALGGKSYKINFYIGNTAGIERNYSNENDNFVGSIYTFSNDPRRCTNCANAESGEQLSGGQILLTTRLIKRFKRDVMYMLRRTQPRNADSTLVGINPDTVSEYLKRNLTWEFRENSGRIRDPTDFPNTKVFVLQGRIGMIKRGLGAAPEHGSYKPMFDATEGKAGGGVGPKDPDLGRGAW